MPGRGVAHQREREEGLPGERGRGTDDLLLSCVVRARRWRRRTGGCAGSWARRPWELRLPDGQVLRSGDVLQDGRRGAAARGSVTGPGARPKAAEPGEQAVAGDAARVMAERFRPELFDFFRWPMAQILEDSPLAGGGAGCRGPVPHLAEAVAGVLNGLDWGCLQLRQAGASDAFPAGCGVVPDRAGDGELHLRLVVQGRAATSRSNENLNGHRFLVIESDTLTQG